jgi:Rhodopirellula transposase DDE domain/Histidine kinase-, DNA gyrase B-, and HSP90-like ATPase
VDVRDAIEWAIRSTAHEFQHRARLSTKLDKVPRVDADETRLGQVLVNLLINAAHAIAPGNVEGNDVSISTRTDDDGRVVIQVSDTGSGMPPEVLSRIFEPFFRRGRPLRSYETVVNLIGNTTNRGGLVVRARLDRRSYPVGRKVSAQEMRALKIDSGSFRGDWNYVVRSRSQES